MLIRTLVLVAVLGCGSSKPAPENPPPAESMVSCDKVADHVAGLVAASKMRSGATHAAVRDMVVTRCGADAWSDATKRCMFAAKAIPEARECASTMTDEQRTAIRTQARGLRPETTAEADDPNTDWMRHVVEE